MKRFRYHSITNSLYSDIADRNQKPVKPEEIMFIKKSDAYLYCEATKKIQGEN